MEAIVLAGGLGTRLRDAVPDLPKPMAPVAGRPFLAWVLEQLVRAGFERAVLAVGYRHEAIRRHFGTRFERLAIEYSIEATPLGTGGALRLAAQHCPARPVFAINGDTYLELDFVAMRAAHLGGDERLTIAACQVADIGRYGALDIEAGHVRGFIEKGQAGPGLINGGCYLLSAEVIDAIPVGVPHSFENQLLVPEVARWRPAAFVTAGRFIDIGVPEDYARAQTLFAPSR